MRNFGVIVCLHFFLLTLFLGEKKEGKILQPSFDLGEYVDSLAFSEIALLHRMILST
jgi:hypothetical protein